MIPNLTRYLGAAALVGAAVFATWQHFKIGNLERQLATVKADRAAEQVAYETASRLFAESISALKTEHAVAQQKKADDHAQNLKRLERAAAVERDRVVGLRDRLEAATSADSRQGDTTDPAACVRDRADLEALGRLAAEGAGLLEEAGSLLAWRDEEVRHLKQQLLLDRSTVEKASALGQPPQNGGSAD